jgi:hypothetical protein
MRWRPASGWTVRVDSLSLIAVRLTPGDQLGLIQFVTSCDILAKRSPRGKGLCELKFCSEWALLQ